MRGVMPSMAAQAARAVGPGFARVCQGHTLFLGAPVDGAHATHVLAGGVDVRGERDLRAGLELPEPAARAPK